VLFSNVMSELNVLVLYCSSASQMPSESLFCFPLFRDATAVCTDVYIHTVNVIVWSCNLDDCYSNSVQANTCLISGNCYDDGESNPENSYQLCDATRNSTAWTALTPTEPAETTVAVSTPSTSTTPRAL